ncbi:hypothetical protein G3I59_32155 [Amycolatopsis rubida]|uniref:Homeodomain-like domain-containing protein n=1 Tax=Amycolatopsis rubida TaxID=112413 RepID=A0ABX0BYG5_9PSEU|nr:helix-turn-helix domain-containing protein [Amycolatopsis sp. M39]MYW90505.1 hypothetical protein [Amycolatopsis rubida]MYW95127.1 hypothetical protein [Amycolatopsis rubida]NEC55485.1 hypothetical protein [Amycolatopsis rubida]NEC60114.1 hypothetical protein [Amycolatopsis rubida]
MIAEECRLARGRADPAWTMTMPVSRRFGPSFIRHPHPFAVWEVIEWYAHGLTATECGERLGISETTVLRWMKHVGAHRRWRTLKRRVRTSRRTVGPAETRAVRPILPRS